MYRRIGAFPRASERARFQRWLEQECGRDHGTLERAESSEIAANRSPPSTGLAHSTYVQVTTAARSSTFTALPSRERSATTVPRRLLLSLYRIVRGVIMIFVCISSFGELKEIWRIIIWIGSCQFGGMERSATTVPRRLLLSLYRIVRLCLEK